jgi:hypothetical protein
MLTYADVCSDDDDSHSAHVAAAGSRYSVYLLYWYKSTNTDTSLPTPAAADKKRGIRAVAEEEGEEEGEGGGALSLSAEAYETLVVADAPHGYWSMQEVEGQVRMLTYADVCTRMMTYAGVC